MLLLTNLQNEKKNVVVSSLRPLAQTGELFLSDGREEGTEHVGTSEFPLGWCWFKALRWKPTGATWCSQWFQEPCNQSHLFSQSWSCLRPKEQDGQSYWDVNMNISLENDGLVPPKWFSSDCRADAAKALLLVSSGFTSPFSVTIDTRHQQVS